MSAGSHRASGSVPGRPVPGDDGRHHRRRLPDPPLRDRLHVGGRGLRPLLRLHEPVRVRDADAGARRQPAGALPRLGRRRPLQLPPDRLLPQGTRERLRRAQGVRGHPRRRHRHAARPFAAVPGSGLHRGAGSDGRGSRALAGRVDHGDDHRPAAARRRGRQVGPGAAADLAARRDGRPDAGVRAHSRRHHGHRRRVPHRAHPRPLPAVARSAVGRRDGGPRDAASSRRSLR